MSKDRTLLIWTRNAGKVLELGEMLAPTGIHVIGLDAFTDSADIDETGSTFEENSRLKAAGYALQTGFPTLADDSGLEVDALGGRPGVLSARYGGDDMAFAEKMQLLLVELEASRSHDRSARFVCSMALASADAEIVATTEGVCNGRLANVPRGSGGFGYDPLFMPDGHDLTFGELSGAVKAQISHRARAFLHIMPILRRFFSIST